MTAVTNKEDLPVDWRWETLHNLGEWSGGGTPSKSNSEFWNQKDIPWVSPKDMKVKNIGASQDYISKAALEKTNLRLVPKGSLLMVTRSGILAHSFPVAINDVPVTVNQDLKVLTLPTDLSEKYLYYALKRYERAILNECSKQGTTVHSIEMPKLMRFTIPIAPPEQQKRIVAKIEELFSHIDAGIEALKKAKQLLKQYRQSVLKAAVTGELTKEWRAANKAKLEPASQLLERILKERRQKWEEQQLEQFKAKGKMPKDDKWKEKYKEPVSLDNRERPTGNENVCEVNIDTLAFVTKLAGFEYTKFVKYDDDGDLAVIKAENAGPFGYKTTDYSKVKSETVEHLTRSKVRAGDLLMVFVGAGTANVAIVPDDQPYFLGPNIAMIRIESSYALPEYLEIYLRSSVGKGAAMSFAKAVAQPSLSMGSIRMVPVLLPNIEEQKVIVDVVNQKIDSLSRLETELETQLAKAERNKQSILASAFSGALN